MPEHNYSDTTLYRLSELERKQSEEFKNLEKKMDLLFTSLNDYMTRHAVNLAETQELKGKYSALDDKLDSLEGKLHVFKEEQIKEFVSLKTKMSTAEKYAPGAITGTGGGLIGAAIVEMFRKLWE